MVRDLSWVFDELPPSGARRGGDPSEHAFKHDLETFVREVVQNANDQALFKPHVAFRFRELRGEARRRFLRALSFEQLEPHLEAAASAMPDGALRASLESFASADRLLLLYVEDRNTWGLTGEESAGDSHFRALCKDTLYSHKRERGAGGSYGLGKSVLWSFSGLSAVIFHSRLIEDPADHKSPRLIGRVELPSHATVDRWWSGSGWLGREVRVDDRGARAESAWGEDAAEHASRLAFAPREESAIGTSILIVGFRDPTSESEDDAIDALVERTRRAAVKHFWPAMIAKRELRIDVGVDAETRPVDPEAEPIARPFVECFRRREELSPALAAPGDVVKREIPFDLPDRRDGARLGTATADLYVRLAREGERDELLGRVAMMRGPHMVVRYWDRSALGAGARPFHALLIAGLARGDSELDQRAEEFLRDAEPPGHDVWEPTPKLKAHYRRGYAKALDQLEHRTADALRALLISAPAQGSRGPERLGRRFPMGKRGGRSAEPSAFHFGKLDARFDGRAWRFSGEVRPEKRGEPWEARFRLEELDAEGEAIGALPIAALRVERGAEATIDEGAAVVAVPAELERVVFEGVSREVLDPDGASELRFEIVGRVGEAG